MTSPSPLLYDTYYHIYNRGTNGDNIFIQEKKFAYFLKLYAKYIEPVTDTYAYCLLRNHFHLVVRIKSEDEIIEFKKTLRVSLPDKLQGRQVDSPDQVECQQRKPLGPKYASNQFSKFFNAYAKGINKAYSRTGSLFQHPFGRIVITTDQQFWRVIAYVHQNPQKHGFVDDFRNWKYSSYGSILFDEHTSLNREKS